MNLDYVLPGDSAGFEKDHWWIRSRFKLIDRLLNQHAGSSALSILEMGCGTGINLDYLEVRLGARLQRLVGIDPLARTERRGKREWRAEIPSGETFDMILAMDVLEHTNRPVEMLQQLSACLKESGRLLVTVPAFQWLWTAYDELSHHHKRYSPPGLLSELRLAGLVPTEHFFLFGFLFPLFVFQRLAVKYGLIKDVRLFKPTPAALNAILYAITAAEMKTVMLWNRLCGSSIVVVAQRRR